MQSAWYSDKKRVIEILSECFAENPGVEIIIGKNGNAVKRLKALSSYVFDYAFYRYGVFLTNDRNGVLICYKNSAKAAFLKDLYIKVKLIIRAIGLPRLLNVLRHLQVLQGKRTGEMPYLYCWFIGVTREGRCNCRTGFEIMHFIFELSQISKLPLYAETSLEQNKKVYERFGFKTYDLLEYKDCNFRLWFMRRDFKRNPDQNREKKENLMESHSSVML